MNEKREGHGLAENDNTQATQREGKRAIKMTIATKILDTSGNPSSRPKSSVTMMFHPDSMPMLRAVLLELHAVGLAWSPDTFEEDAAPPLGGPSAPLHPL